MIFYSKAFSRILKSQRSYKMNNRKLSKIITLYHEGASCESCVAMIIELSATKSKVETAIFIHSFYEQVFDLNLRVK